MYAFIRGILISNNATQTVVEANGIGYSIGIPTSDLQNLPQVGSEILLHTSLVVREQSHTLYGFLGAQEKDLFEVLTTINGIGPKIALSVIGHLPLLELQKAISQGNPLPISKVPGIGKKKAERLLIEMRDKLPNLFPSDVTKLAVKIPGNSPSQSIQDAMGALVNLGYNQAKAEEAIRKTIEKNPSEMDLPNLITQALKHV